MRLIFSSNTLMRVYLALYIRVAYISIMPIDLLCSRTHFRYYAHEHPITIIILSNNHQYYHANEHPNDSPCSRTPYRYHLAHGHRIDITQLTDILSISLCSRTPYQYHLAHGHPIDIMLMNTLSILFSRTIIDIMLTNILSISYSRTSCHYKLTKKLSMCETRMTLMRSGTDSYIEDDFYSASLKLISHYSYVYFQNMYVYIVL